MPFVTEVMYQNLVRSVYPQAYESVHHTAWPAGRRGRRRREPAGADGAGAPGRQPGAERAQQRQPEGAPAAGRGRWSTPAGSATCSAELVEIVTDELNVKSFEFVEQASQLVHLPRPAG